MKMKSQGQFSYSIRLARNSVAIVAILCVLVACGPGGGSGSTGGTGEAGYAPSLPVVPAPDYKPRALSAKVFESGSRTYAPMDIESYALTMTFDAAARTFAGFARITFQQKQRSRPIFLLDGTVQSARLNGTPVSVARVRTPGGYDSAAAIGRELNADETAFLEVTYKLPAGRISYSGNGGVGFLTDMADISGVFLERWAPANYEDDQFPMTLELIVTNSSANHQVFANGEVSELGKHQWLIRYPAHFTSTSIFAHLTDRRLTVKRFAYPGAERDIPVTVYSGDSSLVASASGRIPALFRELENEYGPYAHAGFIAYIGQSSGGMEYAGATITSLKSLSHELFHSWFARGVLPAEGRSGWIDEAIASWRDHGYARSSSRLSRSATNLASYSAFRRSTPGNSYADGRALLAEWDSLFAGDGGFRPYLRDLYRDYQGKVITTEELWSFLQETSGQDLSPYFQRYVFNGANVTLAAVSSDPGGDAVGASGAGNGEPSQGDPSNRDEAGNGESLHPTPLTEAELRQLR